MKKFLALALALVCALSLSVTAFAEDTQPAAENTETTIPVVISAQATTFNVTLPTALPSTVDPETGDTTEGNGAKIVNGSAGAIRVSNISITTKDSEDQSFGWTLESFDVFDFLNAEVDSNQVGVSVMPVGGREKLTANTATALKTVAGAPVSQTLLTYTKGGENNTASASQWVIDAKNSGEDNTDELTISYDTKATPVSADITNEQVASIIITVAWDKG